MNKKLFNCTLFVEAKRRRIISQIKDHTTKPDPPQQSEGETTKPVVNLFAHAKHRQTISLFTDTVRRS